MVYISPSILACDFAHLAKEVSAVSAAGAQWLHLDVMDGHFVPNITFGSDLVKSIRAHSGAFFDVHLMIEDPFCYADRFIDAGADLVTFHLEAPCDTDKTIEKIRARGKKVGLSIKPGTAAAALAPYLDRLDFVLVMTVEPGFGGQAFMCEMLPKIEQVRAMIQKTGREILIGADGGISEKNVGAVYKAGARVLVAGSSVFRAPDSRQAIEALCGACQES